MTLTRRDRAAMRLAYESCRSHTDPDMARVWAYCALECGGDVAAQIVDAMDRQLPTRVTTLLELRLLRTRLALLLRAMLRGECSCNPDLMRRCDRSDCPYFWQGGLGMPRRYTALWERAGRRT